MQRFELVFLQLPQCPTGRAEGDVVKIDQNRTYHASLGKTGRIHFRRPVPVILFYGTVSVNEQGTVTFREDVYDRDPKLLAALDAPAGLWWGMGRGR